MIIIIVPWTRMIVITTINSFIRNIIMIEQ